MSAGDMGSMRLQQQAVEVELDLMTFLWQTFWDIDREGSEADAKSFPKWARDFLANNRPSTTFPADQNVGITLADGRQLLIAPAAGRERGEMKKTPLGVAQRVGVPDVFADQGAVPISGRPQKQSGQVDYSQMNERNFANSGGTKEDATQSKKAENLAQDRPYGREL